MQGPTGSSGVQFPEQRAALRRHPARYDLATAAGRRRLGCPALFELLRGVRPRQLLRKLKAAGLYLAKAAP